MQLNPIQELQRILNETAFSELSDRLKFGCQYSNHSGIVTICDARFTEQILQLGFESIYDFSNTNTILGFPLSLDLILLALEKKGMPGLANSWKIEFYDNQIDKHYSIAYTPFQPIPEDSIKTLIQILK